jgi:hypothetical protein
MGDSLPKSCTAFAGTRQIATGGLNEVTLKAQELVSRDPLVPVLIFDDTTSHVIEVDLRGTAEDLRRRIAAAEPVPVPANDHAAANEGPRGPGRPKLGVVAREVTLLPRHWEWLASQPGGASVALRKLVEEAKRANQGKDRLRRARESTYRFISAMAGNEAGFEEATRALFVGNGERFAELVAAWPVDVGNHAKKLAGAAFAGLDSAPLIIQGSDRTFKSQRIIQNVIESR